MTNLPNITMVAITTRDYGPTVQAIKKSLELVRPHSTIFFSDVQYDDPDFECILIPKLNWHQYNEFVCTELWKHITTTHVLLIQHDGHVLDDAVWTDEFMDYDYIGAPWTYKDGRNVGNGGFSLRSKRLQHILATDPAIEIYSPEDEIICRLYRHYLEKTHSIRFAPEELAHRFSFEMQAPRQKTFGFHNHFHEPYREPIVLKRDYAMGDIIMMEPVMEWFYQHNYQVILDIPPEHFNLFVNHYFPVYHLSQFKQLNDVRVVNLNMGYEITPKQLVLKSYYALCGIADGDIRNSRLNFLIDGNTKLFKKYVVLHIDDTALAHRNVHGVSWPEVVSALEDMGYSVIRIGAQDIEAGLHMNCRTKNMLMYLLAGADFFIGIDSGPSHVAVALGVRSILFFGSVNPEYRYADLTNIRVIQGKCPIQKDYCYHTVIGEAGVNCEVDEKLPPCITWTTKEIILKIHQHINSF